MNKLQSAFNAVAISDYEGMDLLQEHGVISDNCVWTRDVPEEDVGLAITWLQKRFIHLLQL